MSQLNINMTPEFEELLRQYMEMNKILHKSEAIRHAVKRAVAIESKAKKPTLAFRDLVGAALKAERNPKPRFRTDDDIWADKKK